MRTLFYILIDFVLYKFCECSQCAQVFYRTSNTYLFFPNGLSEFFYPMDIYWIFHPGYNRCSDCWYSYTLKGCTSYI